MCFSDRGKKVLQQPANYTYIGMPFRTFPEPYAHSPHRIFKTSELHRAVHRLQHAGKHYVPMRTHTCTINGHSDFTTRAKACKYIEPGNAENKKIPHDNRAGFNYM